MQYSSRLLPALIALSLTGPPLVPPAIAVERPPLVLAETYQKGIDLTRYWVSEKYDGARAWWDGRQFISRGGNVYHAPHWFTENLPDHTLDGELWMGRGNFQLLMQTIRDHKPDDIAWRAVRFMVFDAPDVQGDFNVRQQRLMEIFTPFDQPWIELVPQHRVSSHSILQARLESVSSSGGEGLMLTREDSRYLAGRHQGLLKMKLHQDAEATVVGHVPGKGKYRNMMGSLMVEDAGGRRFRLGTGFTDAERAAPPPLGAIVSYRYQGRTRSGKPRFARFLRERPAE